MFFNNELFKMLLLFLFVATEVVTSSTPVSRLWISKACPYAQRSWIASIEKNVDVELKFEDLQNKSKEFCDLYSQISPDPLASAKVPIFEDGDGFKLIESSIIAQYLDEKFPTQGNNLIPQLASEKATCRLFVDCFEKTISPLNVGMLIASGNSTAMEKLSKNLPTLLQTLNRYLEFNADESGPFILGDRFSIAEVLTAPFIQRIYPVGKSFCSIDLLEECEKAGCDRLRQWMEATLARESVKSTKVADENLINTYMKMKERMMNMQAVKGVLN
jgi:glutathione S-transferase